MLLAAMLLSSASAFAQSRNTSVKGDVNGDGIVDVADIAAVIQIMKGGGGTVTVGGYFYLGTTQPTAENYKTLPGVVTSHTSIDDAVGTMVSVAAGETLYMLCPAAWMEGNSVKLEDNAKNKFSFFYEKDAATLPGYVIYNTQVWDAPNNVVLKIELQEEISQTQSPFPDTFIPKKVYGVIGDMLQIFDRGVTISQEPYRFYNDWACGQGKIYQRYLEITPALVNGTVPTGLTIKHMLIDDHYNKSEQKTASFVIADRPSSSPSSNINVLCVGASTTANGEWASELKRRLTGTRDSGTPAADGLTNINFVGRTELAASSIRPVAVNVEATGGWQWKTFYTPQDAVRLSVSGVTSVNIGDVYKYLNANDQEVRVAVAEVNITAGSGNIRFTYSYDTNGKGVPALANGSITKVRGSGDVSIVYSDAEKETYCPFYDESTKQPDFATYAENYCNSQIDVVIFNLGNINAGIMGNDPLTTILANMKTMLDALHADFPDCKVIIAPGCGYSTYYGVEYNYNASSKYKSWPALYAQFRYAKAIEDFIGNDDYKDWCFLANTIAETDSENVFPTSAKAVNSRVSTTEVIGTNGAHPTLQGYQMVADSFYRCFVNKVLN